NYKLGFQHGLQKNQAVVLRRGYNFEYQTIDFDFYSYRTMVARTVFGTAAPYFYSTLYYQNRPLHAELCISHQQADQLAFSQLNGLAVVRTSGCGRSPQRQHERSTLQPLRQRREVHSLSVLYDQLLGQERQDGHARSAFRHVDYCEDQPGRPRDNQQSPEPGVLTPLATWTLLSCLFSLFLCSRSIWSKGSLWGGLRCFWQND